MLAAIDFDNKPMLLAHKINNEWTNRGLTTEAQAIESMRTQCSPQTALCICHFMTQRFRKSSHFWRNRTMRRLLTPLPDRFAVRPPPQGGR